VIPRVEISPGTMIPRVIVGAWQLSAGHRQTSTSREELFRHFTEMADLGLTAFDCADIYTGVEEFLGEFSRRYARARGTEAAAGLRFHTKYVPDYDRLATVQKADVARIVDRSLARLGVERLDLVQFAWWSYGVDRWVAVAGWLDELRQAGKIAALGATNFDAPSLGRMLDAGIPITSHQLQYSALDHRPEGEMGSLCQAGGVGLICYGALAGGFLSDRYLGMAEPTPPFENRSLVKYRLIIEEYGGWEAYQELLETLRRVGDVHDASVAQVALAYALSRPAVAAVLVGASRPDRMAQAAAAASLTLSATEQEGIRAIAAAALGPSGPVFGLERGKDSPHGRIMKYDLNRNRDSD
jgi:aryl-alcohol dehydrogenase-like predicted oxidoreductase